jgi:hypothetical protein
MPDLSEKWLPRLKAQRLPELDLGAEFVYPNYDGYSLLNLPGGICRLLGIPVFAALPLSDELLQPFMGHYRRVVLLVIDGLGLFRFQNYLQQGLGTAWKERLPQAALAPLTSVCPSTTASALTTLWTGASTAAHGIAGYELWLKEYGVTANMITHTPMTFLGDSGGLKRAGFQPETFLPVPTLGPHLVQYGIQPHAFMHHTIARSGLSAMHLSQANLYPFHNPGDMLVSLRNLLNEHPGESLYTYVYWGDLDELSHRFGPDDERVAVEFDSFSRMLGEQFLGRLTPAARKDTLLLMTADHGQVSTPKYAQYDLQKHPDFMQALHIWPTGENRLAYLHVRPGQVKFVREYVEKTWPGQITLIPTAQVLRSGLMGPGKRHPRLEDRLGDFIAFTHGDAYWWWAEKENPLLGRHGGLSQHEMVVPLYALAL